MTEDTQSDSFTRSHESRKTAYAGGLHPNWLKAWALRLAVLRGRKRATVALNGRGDFFRCLP